MCDLGRYFFNICCMSSTAASVLRYDLSASSLRYINLEQHVPFSLIDRSGGRVLRNGSNGVQESHRNPRECCHSGVFSCSGCLRRSPLAYTPIRRPPTMSHARASPLRSKGECHTVAAVIWVPRCFTVCSTLSEETFISRFNFSSGINLPHNRSRQKKTISRRRSLC